MTGKAPGTTGLVAFQHALAGEEDRLLTCVHCGFCLDVCPTYRRLGLESDSPRGRLYLMRALAEGRIQPDSDALHLHIDRCLGCRACEPVCPSGVPYGHLLERTREVIAGARASDPLARVLLTTFGGRAGTRAVGLIGRATRGSGLASFLARHLPDRFERSRFAFAMLAVSRPWQGLRLAGSKDARSSGDAASAGGAPPERGPRVAVLRGCVQSALFARVNSATDRVLRSNGCTLVQAPAQVCCGALHAHGGSIEGARALARRNIDAFERAGVDFIVVNAAGCGATLKEYGELFEGRPWRDRAETIAARVLDLSELLVRLGPRPGAPLPLRAAYDAPCHLLHAQRISEPPLRMLDAVPGLDVVPVPGADECCGGAGIHGLVHAELGSRILEDKVRAVKSVGADVVITPNPGCMMQIGAGLLLAGDQTPVLHPVELLDESYRRSGYGQPG